MFNSIGRPPSRGQHLRDRSRTCVRDVLHYHPRVQEAAGYIVYVIEDRGPRFLLMRNAKHHTWGFPKGKLEDGEDARAGALRELREETRIAKIRPDDGFVAESTYDLPRSARGGVESDDEPARKRVRYFLARADDARFERSEEHDAADWMIPEEVLATLRHEDLRRVFREAMAHLRTHGIGSA
jgi:8-oxo-dGTP diphosphatase